MGERVNAHRLALLAIASVALFLIVRVAFHRLVFAATFFATVANFVTSFR